MTDTSILFSPVRMGGLALPNRVLMAPLTRNRSHADGTPWEAAQTYYAQRASAGMILTEATQISAMGKGYKDTPGIHDASHVAAWKKITDAVHAQGGRIYMQLWHVGRISHNSLLPEGQTPQAPSAVSAQTKTFTENGFEDCSEPHAVTIDEIDALIEDYRVAAQNAKEAGFDGVEIHGANGYLIDQFLQDKTNRRDDEYGGAVENRMRFLRRVIDAVLGVWDRDRVGIRLSPLGQANDISDSDPEGLFTQVYKLISGEQLAYLHVVEEFFGSDTTQEQRDILERLRGHFDGFYISNGGFDAASAADVIAKGHADAVAFGRDFIANPDLPERFRQGAALNPQDQDTFYGGDETGYTDYPFLEKIRAA
ncbi:N-ethylmaleimide reductase [Palleronia marisminoris]|uniref:N-ethylmaleimide reductase n=1 Tax=Palleronia marisminoris TaxID=315423 RepID=A0A1Y5RGZ0_9RHOB|nr:alkene reductase [Palleronia marisminoris]SFG19530.1 N-ethylmaleimide reductase [Palleronia marisminoris]SLN17209.1 N-ethylmaleimide reductase [Palleronia marisminoris]